MISYALRFLALTLFALLLSACSIEGMAEKMIPESVRLDAQKHVDALSNNDISLIISAFEADPEDESVKAQLDSITAQIIEGPEIRRDIVGANASKSFNASTSEGAQSQTTYDLTYEIEKADGFMAITTTYNLNENGECCRITNINAQKFEASPYRAGLEAMKKGFKIAAIIIGVFLLLLVFFLVRRSRRKKATSA